jgi:hypothetical protein
MGPTGIIKPATSKAVLPQDSTNPTSRPKKQLSGPETWVTDFRMQTVVNLPDSLYRKSQSIAASRGVSVEQVIVEAIAKEVEGDLRPDVSGANHEVVLPVIRSLRPGTLDLSRFDFDDLLA